MYWDTVRYRNMQIGRNRNVWNCDSCMREKYSCRNRILGLKIVKKKFLKNFKKSVDI